MPRHNTQVNGPDPVDVHVGMRLRRRREALGRSQSDLAKALGMTFQQIQKYENGANRVSASKLWYISAALDCPVSYFFEQYGDEDTPRLTPRIPVGLVRAYEAINAPELRVEAIRLLRVLSEVEDRAA